MTTGTIRTFLIPAAVFVSAIAVMSGIYLGLLSALESWEYALFQFSRDRIFVVPLILAFAVQSALYSILRFRLYAPAVPRAGGVMLGAGGGTSTTAMLACCLHHAVDVFPVLGISAATAFLAQYQRPFMQFSLLLNVAGIAVMVRTLQNARQRLQIPVEAK